MDKVDREILKKNAKEALSDNAEGLLEEISGIGKVLSKIAKTVKQFLKGYREDNAKKEEAEKKCVYMHDVVFCCNPKTKLEGYLHERLWNILEQNYDQGDTENLGVVNDFIDKYMAGYVNVDDTDCLDNGGDCGITEDSFSMLFSCDNHGLEEDETRQHVYNEEDIIKLKDALNALLEFEVFDRYEIHGHDENWDD